jgi:hypothetical protein
MTNARTIALTAIPPLVGTGVSVAILANLDLPAQVAVHWGLDGVDRVASRGDLIAPVAIFVPLIAVLMVVALVFASRMATHPLLGRFMVALSSTVGLGVAFIPVALGIAQVEVVDVESVSVGTGLLAVGSAILAAAMIGVALAFLAPRTAVVESAFGEAPALALGESERASWSRSVGPSRVALGILGAAIAVVVAVLLIAGAPLVLTLVVSVVTAGVTGLLFWRVTVDANGITVRSALAVPRVQIRPADVVAARAIEVSPMRQFGGWGIRIGASGWGIIVRSGSAIEVERVGKSPFIVTVDDAATGAALLTAIAQRARG